MFSRPELDMIQDFSSVHGFVSGSVSMRTDSFLMPRYIKSDYP